MGAMTGVMLGEDILWFMPPFMVLNCIIMFGLVYMVFKEVTATGSEAPTVPSPRFLPFFFLNLTSHLLRDFKDRRKTTCHWPSFQIP